MKKNGQPTPDGKEGDFFVESIFGLRTQKPLVKISFNGKEIATIMPDEAQDLALSILAAAEASIGDAFLVTFLRKRVGALSLRESAPMADSRVLSDHEIAGVIKEFREWRTQYDKG